MKANNKMNELRKSQRQELTSIVSRLSEIDKIKTAYYKANPYKGGFRTHEETLKWKAATCYDECQRLTARKEFLETELIEKKYANHYMYSDVVPYEVVEEKSENVYVVRAMKYAETKTSKKQRMESFVPGGFCGTFDNNLQKWSIEPNPDETTFVIRRHKDGFFYNHGRKFKIHSEPIRFYDFNF